MAVKYAFFDLPTRVGTIVANAARAEAAGAVASILDGAISVLPRDEGYCGRFCEFGSVCRVKWKGSGNPDEVEGSAPL